MDTRLNTHFLFTPGQWLGTGEVHFTMSTEVLQFRTKWVVTQEEDDLFNATQVVEVVGGDRIANLFEISKEGPGSFEIILENELLGTFIGNGIIEDERVAWEFRDKGTFEGYEVYNRVSDTEYTMHAEYLSSDQLRTEIRGRIWLQS